MLVGLAIVRIDAEIVFFQDELFRAKGSVLEIENTLRVESLAHVTCFEMEVWPCGTPCGAAIANQFASLDEVTAFDDKTRQVSIIGFQSVGMPDNQYIAVSSCHIDGQGCAYYAIESRVDGIASVEANVDALVCAFPSVFIARSDLARMRDAVSMRGIDERELNRVREVFQGDVVVRMHFLGNPMVGFYGIGDVRHVDVVIQPGSIVEKYYLSKHVIGVEGVNWNRNGF